MRTTVLLLALWLASGAAADEPLGTLPDVTLTGSDGVAHRLYDELAHHKALVIEFFSAHCPCQRAHDARLKALYQGWIKADVAFFPIDSESGVSAKVLKGEVQERGYPFPILLDPDGKLAKQLSAKFCLTSLVVDPSGKVRYLGGIDGDRTCLNAGAGEHAFLKNAVESVLAGREPNPSRTKSLGCYLTQW